jgi:acetyl esterase/lipase
VLHLARSFPEKWCAISASDGPPWPGYPVERLRSISGVLFVHGGRDTLAKSADTQRLAARARAAGVRARMHLVPDGTHGDAWVRYLPSKPSISSRRIVAAGDDSEPRAARQLAAARHLATMICMLWVIAVGSARRWRNLCPPSICRCLNGQPFRRSWPAAIWRAVTSWA